MNARSRLLVVGNGMVGQRFLESMPSDASFDITVLGEEPRPAYDRVQLSAFFSGKTADDLSLVEAGFFTRNNIGLKLGERVESINLSARKVRTSHGHELEYDTLVLATGSYPFVPPIAGRDRPHCHVYRTIEDLEAIRSSSQGARVGVVLGGGLLGLEAAKALRDLGLETNVVEFAPRLMALQVDDGGGQMLRRRIEALGVRVHTGKNTANIVAGGNARHRMNFSDGSSLEADVIVFSAGIRPRDELARAAGLAIGERGGIVIDDNCRTSDPDIYAIGECALWRGRIFGLVAPGYDMARVAAATIGAAAGAAGIAGMAGVAGITGVAGTAGAAVPVFAGADMSTKLKLLGVGVASIGDAHAASPGARAYSFADERREVYKKLVVTEDGSRLLGAVLVGDTDDYGSWLQTMLNGLPLPEHPEDLIVPPRAGASHSGGSGLAALPADAQICSCNNVSKGAICAAVGSGCTTVGAIKKATRAATSCGGCAPLVTQVLQGELKRKGISFNTHLCEHFPYSRQQLFSLVRVGGLRSFDATLANHGRGLGCDICKPAVASILASCWNEFVLAREHASLQDTNDYFLANMQKDGTYSVVPRVPGGEITPEKLIVLGEVARKFGLYTKITGGQRIDLFGAQVHQLPLIWAELIAAGFESGHAYGKAMRTVKSCVGSTWCRFGVQDSVGLAIEIENRYRGLRAPHKIKLGVSGCTRECAEAQGKDVGVIATEKGWNLYVCGNGGIKPRHAELLAADLDKDTLIRYIDRFLMFYIRTADRLQRTSTWRDSLEGGLDYLKQVVCEDKLGIAAELEADMAQNVARYECEWRKAIEDPSTLARFRHFVNSDATDPNVIFVQERGQVRPATHAERSERSKAAV
ncbi:MAG TPA: nitrite reductase large subunit NirB [Steroidobacteraceae bacterium]|nr:nitrite reductase large subunit NirB [Steroidobacteraceae bacterium]